MRQLIKPLGGVLLFWILASVALHFYRSAPDNFDHLSYDQLISTVESGNIKSIFIYTNGEIEGDYLISSSLNKKSFKSRINSEDEKFLTEKLIALNPRPKIIKYSPADIFVNIFLFFGLLMILFIIKFLWLLSKAGKTSVFGSKKGHQKDKPKERFKDVAGVDEAQEELREIVEFLANPYKYTVLGGRLPKGVLLIGPTGVGKTLLARAVAGEANVRFLSASGSEFIEMFVGVGASRVRDLFAEAKQSSPCIVFIDEIDSLGRRDSGIMTGSSHEHDQTINQILTEMDGFESSSGVIVIGATNREDKLDYALLRPGRFDRRVYVNLPDIKGREQILNIHIRRLVLDEKVDLKILAKMTPGFSGADLANLVNEAAIMAAKAGQKTVTVKYFELAQNKILLGRENQSLSSVMTEEEKITTAVHEAGHALVALMMPESDPIYKVSIIPRGRALGVTSQIPESDRHNVSEEYLFGKLCMLFGGRVAEELVLNKITAGAKNDIEKATALAQSMVYEFGMSRRLGPINYKSRSDNNYRVSEDTKREIDIEVKHLINRAYLKATDIINKNMDKLKKIVNALIEKETLGREEVEQI